MQCLALDTEPKAEDLVVESWDLEDSPTSPTRPQGVGRSQSVLTDAVMEYPTELPPDPTDPRQPSSSSHHSIRARSSVPNKPHSVERLPAYLIGADSPLEYSCSTAKEAPGNRASPGGALRPEKTTAVASRLIAGALGVKAPPRTEEQRAYDRAAKEKETRRRQKEKEDKKLEEKRIEQAKRDVWDG